MKIILKVLLMSILASSCARNKKDIMVIGHRGARGHVAENTIASIKKAMELGVDGIEIDVFRCSTGELAGFS
jgi:glycerophosphoryl diester phosphodiesterase